MRLTSIIMTPPTDSEGGGNYVHAGSAVPNWVWKGVLAQGQAMSIPLQNTESDELLSLAKILDTFILTSPLGEFNERMELLRICADQQESVYSSSISATPWNLQQSRVLRSIRSHYIQFEEMLASKLDGLIAPLQSKLEAEVKLARWDDQTYYALAESTERNHRKLMKVLAELDECLDLSIGQLIQQEKVKGIRGDVDSNTDISTAVPTESAMFPAVNNIDEKAVSVGRCHDVAVSRTHCWTAADELNFTPTNDHIRRIQKYATKMGKHLVELDKSGANWATFGAECSSDLCNAVLDRIGTLRAKSTRPMKERALTDLFRELKRHGFTSTKWSVPDQLRNMQELFQLPDPACLIDSVDSVTVGEMSKADKYYQRTLAELNEYRSESMLLGSKHLTKRQIDMMLTLGESGLLMIAQQRCLLALLVRDTSRLKRDIESLIFDSMELPLQQSIESRRSNNAEVAFLLAIERIRQLLLLVNSSPQLLSAGSESEWVRDTVVKLDGCVDLLEKQIKIDRSAKLVTYTMLKHLDRKVKAAQDVCAVVLQCKDSCRLLGCLPLDCFDVVIDSLNQVRLHDLSTVDVEFNGVEQVVSSATAAIEKSLIAFQAFVKATQTDASGENVTLWECHKQLITTWSSSELAKVSTFLARIAQELKDIHEVEGDISSSTRKSLVGLACDVRFLVEHVYSHAMLLLENTASFHACSSKLMYVVMRVFRVLLSKGFCSDESTEDDASDAGGGVEGMTFKDDQDGTGMGEGDGKRDVTDQLESEDQLSGLKNDQDDGKQERESRQLNEDEANQGMEMEADFDGEMCDVPDRPQDDETEEKEGEEELDRELSEEASPDEQVVDERMWNDSDDENEIKKEEEKFEKDSGVEGDAIEGAMRTKEEDEDNNGEQPDQHKQKEASDPQESKEDEQELGDEMNGDVNEEKEDQYEEGHGVDVKGDDREHEEEIGSDQEMQLDDDMDLDADDDPVDMDENDEGNFDDENPAGADDINDMNVGPEPENEEDNEESEHVNEAATPSGTADHAEGEEPADEDQQEEPKDEEITASVQKQEASEVQAHGIRASDGTEGILDAEGEDDDNKNEDFEGTGDTSGAQGSAQSQSDSKGGSGTSERDGAVDGAQEEVQHDGRDEIPNPFKNPGDATKFWHKKLNIVQNDDSADEQPQESDPTTRDSQPAGDFEYTSQEDENPMQVLGEAPEEDAVELSKAENEADKDQQPDDSTESNKSKPSDDVAKSSRKKHSQPAQRKDQPGENTDELDERREEQGDTDSDAAEATEEADDLSKKSEVEAEQEFRNKVESDLSRLTVTGEEGSVDINACVIEDEQVTGISSSEAAAARCQWLQIQGETHNLARRLCEKLRLVMEPLVASKLRGDYRTGKRINMKRVIGYIASGYRRDKIWLRRTKPAKRDYRVLLAVDDSESMKKSGAGEMALRALATLAMGMNQLEIGELGIASFGEDMRLLHPFHMPFGTDSGSDMVMNFKFDQKRTRTSLCVESAIVALEAMGGNSSMQLVFLVSDGRIERDSRDKLKGLIREMMERNILLAMIIVEGDHKKKDSILNMKEVTFERGKPVVKRFIEDYPFPYYIVLDDMAALPEILGDALRQWFEMLTHIQAPR